MIISAWHTLITHQCSSSLLQRKKLRDAKREKCHKVLICFDDKIFFFFQNFIVFWNTELHSTHRSKIKENLPNWSILDYTTDLWWWQCRNEYIYPWKQQVLRLEIVFDFWLELHALCPASPAPDSPTETMQQCNNADCWSPGIRE